MVLLFESVMLNLATTCAAFFVGLYIYFIRNFNFWKELGIPYVKPVPFVGNLKELVFLKIGIGHQLQKFYDEHKDKPYVGIFSFDKPSLVIRDLDLVKNILVKDSHNFIDHILTMDENFDPICGKTLLALKGQRWRHMRVNLTPVFTSAKMKRMFYLVENCAKELAHYLDRATADGSTVDVKKTMSRFTTDVIASCAFGIDINSLKNPEADLMRYLRKVYDMSIRKGLAMVTAFFAPSLNKFLRLKYLDDTTSNFFRETVWSTVEYREKHGVVRKDFLDCMMELRNKGKNDVTPDALSANNSKNDLKFDIDGDDFVAQAFGFLAAGFETSSSTMSFALYELAVQPNLQHRLRTEITQVLSKHHGEVTYDAVQEMSYLDMVVSETLRKYPVLPFLDRMCNSDYKLPAPSGKGTVTLPAGTGVYIPVIAFQHDPQYFPEPEKFDPERFTEEIKQSRPNCTYFPFGEGPRSCIGMRFGLMMLKTGLIQILSRYEVASCRDTPMLLTFNPRSFVLLTDGEIRLSFKRF